jgi:hypothetical protein
VSAPKITIRLKKWADNNNVSNARARVWASTGRLKGAKKIGRDWILPWDTKRPRSLLCNGEFKFEADFIIGEGAIKRWLK